MIQFPDNIAGQYRPATDAEIRTESFGVLKIARINAETDWRKQRGTFDDQAMFGPVKRFACACGKYEGEKFARIICDQCGVKITTPDVRRSRCGHINLPAAIVHPLGEEGDQLKVVPVLPVAFVETPEGGELIQAYDAILRAEDAAGISSGFSRVLELLLPVLAVAHQWGLAERLLIAHGMGLIERSR